MRRSSRNQQLAKVTQTYFSGVGADAEAANVLARFTETSKYGHQAARRGLEPAKFGLFVDATKCKGCAECVAVCPAGALRMTDKVADAGNGRSTIESAARDMAFYRSLPTTPEAYRSDKVLADLMLGARRFRLRRRRRFLCRLRRSDRHPDDGGSDQTGARSRVDGDRGGHRL